jgi:hypothetical protein
VSYNEFTRSELQLIRRKLSERLHQVRIEMFGAHGAPELARLLGVPTRTWISYEKGVTMPSEVVLLFLELTRCCPRWLLTGLGQMYEEERYFAEEIDGIGKSFDLREPNEWPERIDGFGLRDSEF